jgi:hypothetical protein
MKIVCWQDRETVNFYVKYKIINWAWDMASFKILVGISRKSAQSIQGWFQGPSHTNMNTFAAN